jgi:dTDP-4-dehydrorhamnose reductase
VRVALVGSSGQFGRALAPVLAERLVWSGGRTDLDVRDAAAVSRMVRESRPAVVVNATACNDVDGAESDLVEPLDVNAAGPWHLARACRDGAALLVHFSSDYVFDGASRRPYVEDDCARPVNAYGISKLAGELLVAASGCEHLLVRTSGLIGAGGSRVKGGSFVHRILEKARAGTPLRVVGDQVFSPTYAPDLARAVLALIESGARGLFHVTNEGSCTWHGLAVAAVEAAGLRVGVEEISSDDLGAPARRPRYSVLSNARYLSLGLPPLRPWQQALRELVAS